MFISHNMFELAIKSFGHRHECNNVIMYILVSSAKCCRLSNRHFRLIPCLNFVLAQLMIMQFQLQV